MKPLQCCKVSSGSRVQEAEINKNQQIARKLAMQSHLHKRDMQDDTQNTWVNYGQCFPIVAQSICTHYSRFEKMGPKYGVLKIGWKISFVIQKEKRQPGFFSFKLQAEKIWSRT